jgi:CIC family chloride channel protein
MVMEMTGSYGLLVPSLVVAALAYLLVPPGVGLYENQVPTRVDSPAHLGSFAAGILRRFRLRDGWSPSTGGVPSGPLVCVRPDESLSRLEGSIGGSAQEMFPVVDASGALAGVFSTEDFRSAFLAEKPDAITVRDFMRKTDPLALDDELNLAAARLAEEGTGVLVVVEDRTALRPLGLFRREDLEAAYGRCLAKLREEPSIA